MSNAGEGLNYTFHCSALAYEFRCLLVVSVAGPAMAIKAIRGALAAGKPTFDFSLPGSESPNQYGLMRDAAGYHLTKPSRLGYGTWHFVAWTLRPEFLACGDDEALWQLFSKRSTTPLLREWMPYLVQQLRKVKVLRNPSSFGCAPALCMATDEALDRIVSAGIRSRELVLPATKPFIRQESES